MNRRQLLQHLLATVPAAAVLPSLLVSCKDTELYANTNYNGRVVIVGAGVAGMYAAWLLQAKGADVTILEATDRHGGRVRPLENFSDFPIELGAEEVHGKRSLWYDLLQNSEPMKSGAVSLSEGDTTDYVWFNGALQEAGILEEDPDLKAAIKLLEDIGDYEGADLTADEWIVSHNLPDHIHPYLNTVIGNEFGASNDRIGVRGIAEGENLWTSGDQNYLMAGGSHLSVMESMFESVLDKIVYEVPVRTITYDTDEIRLTDAHQNSYTADKVIVAVPLPILADEYIIFDPPLPAAKVDAAKSLGMGAGMKIILQFAERFWPEDLGSILGGEVVPEYWSTGTGRSAANNVLTAFVHGSKAEPLSLLGDLAVPAVVEELAAMYDRTPAELNGLLTNSYIMDWGAEPFTRGTYSFPTPGSDGARTVLAEPLVEKVFFAGEATNLNGHFATVHGAMETGAAAARAILNTAR